MSSEDGSRTGAPDVENTLVAALGFEPTSGVLDDPSNVLVDDGTGDALDWSGSEASANGGDAALDVPPTTAKVADSMTPPKGKGKGKGPRTYRSSKPSTSEEPADAANGSSPPSDASVEHDDPVDLIDGDSSGVKPVEADSGPPGEPTVIDDLDLIDETEFDTSAPDPDPLDGLDDISDPPPDATARGLFDHDVSGPPPGSPALGLFDGAVDPTGPLPAGMVDATGPYPRSTIPTDPPPPGAETVAVDQTMPVDGLLVEAPPTQMTPAPPAAETIVDQAPPTSPPMASPHAAAPANPDLIAPTGAPMAEVAPVLDPPPPVVENPAPPMVGDANGATIGAAAGAVVTNRAATGPGLSPGELAAKVPQLLDNRFLKRTRRVRARKVRRVVRHIDPWSVLTFSVLFFLCLFAALLLASVLVWNAAVAAGTIEKIEGFIREIGDYQTYEIKGDVVFRAAMIIAGIFTLAASVMVVLLTVVFNLISDLVGGIRLTVVEEETVRVRRRNQ